MSVLLSGSDIRELAQALGLRPTKSRGQNFVTDPNTVRKIVSAARLPESSTVAEIGPGLGSLTLGLLEAGHRVCAVEIDERLAELLPQTLSARGLPDADYTVVQADALRVSELPRPAGSVDQASALVANLPYNVAVPVLLTFLQRFPALASVLVMVQAEVADRLAAVPGSRTYGVPSVKAQFYGQVERAGDIGRMVFWPPPNVDSGLVRITCPGRKPESLRAAVFAVVDAAFAQRRKTLRSALSGWAGGRDRAEHLLTTVGIDPSARGEMLSVLDYEALATAHLQQESVQGEDAHT